MLKPARRIGVTTHARRRLKARFGTGCPADTLARRCWDKGEAPPTEWDVPMDGRSRYLRYGDHVFVYAQGRYGDKVLITVVGPLGHGRKWQKQHEDQEG